MSLVRGCEFKMKVEMKQTGVRQEAGEVGGIGSCGRELCCSTWLTDFRSVSTASARYQQLSLNPQKLAGQCGKLKCCLNYELDLYLEALKNFPATDTKLKTEKGLAFCQKADIFKGMMWFSYKDDPSNWHRLSTEQVNEILDHNKNGDKKIASLEEYAVENVSNENLLFENAVGQDSLTRFDKPKRSRNRRKKRSRKNRNKQSRNA